MISKEKNCDVSRLTTFGIHANAATVVRYSTVEDLKAILADETLPYPLRHIGEGSNLLFTKDFSGTLIISENREISFEENGDDVIVTVGAGLSMDTLCRIAAENGYWGIENLSGIPGTVGAAAVQNIGAYGVEFCDVMLEISSVGLDGKEYTFSNSDMDYGYRHSLLKTSDFVGKQFIYRVKLKLSKKETPRLGYGNLKAVVEEMSADGKPQLQTIREAVIQLRDSKLPNPKEYGNAGSFFKNPIVTREKFEALKSDNPDLKFPFYETSDGNVKIPAAFLIDSCGMKGRMVGGAKVWERQPLVLVNFTGNATSADVIGLENDIIQSVDHRFGIHIEPEVEHI